MRKLLAPLAIILLAATGCSGQSQPEPAPAGDDVQKQTAEPQPGFSEPAAFGDTVTFPNGLEVSVEALPLKPNNQEETMVETTDMVAAFELTLTNETGERFDTEAYSGALGTPGLSHPGQETNNLNESPSFDALFPGDSETSTFSYFVPGPATVRVEVPAPDMGQPAVFEGELTK